MLLFILQQCLQAQAAFDLWGRPSGIAGDGAFTLSAPGALREWGLSIVPGVELGSSRLYTIYGIAAARMVEGNYYFARYTPGLNKEFRFSSAEQFTGPDSADVALRAALQYREVFAAAYQTTLSTNLVAGMQLRYYTQEFTRDAAGVVFKPDSLYLVRESFSETQSQWRFDLSLSFRFSAELRAGISTAGLLTLNRGDLSEANRQLTMRNRRQLRVGADYHPNREAALFCDISTAGAIWAGGSYRHKNSMPELSLSLFRREDDKRLFSGGTATIAQSFGSWGLSLTGIAHLHSLGEAAAYADFARDRISEPATNAYAISKLLLGISLSLSAGTSKKAVFTGKVSTTDIFPCLTDAYAFSPFAYAKAVNISAAPVTVTPASKINSLHNELIYSAPVTIAPGDTADIQFITYVPEQFANPATVLGYASYYLFTEAGEPDDQLQEPLLVHGINAWNGNSSALGWFVARDIAPMAALVKSILAMHKSMLDTLSADVTDFYKAKLLFDEAFRQIVYVADPKASADRVQFPSETLQLKGGDCDDLCVLAAGLFAAAGLPCAFIDYRPTNGEGHLQLLVNTRLSPTYSNRITGNDRKYFVRTSDTGADELWLPIEVTALRGFDHAWETGAQRFTSEAIEQYGLADGRIVLVDY